MTATSDTPRARSVPAWLLEGIFIVVSVILGFGVTQYGEYRNNRELAARALTSLQAEIEQNLAAVTPYEPIHREWVKALAGTAESEGTRTGLGVFFATRPRLHGGAVSSFPILRRSAWDTTVAGGALRFIDYDVSTVLSEIYLLQEVYAGNIERLSNGPLASIATFDPATRGPAVRLLVMTLRDIQGTEAGLVQLYGQHLPKVRAAAEAAR